MATYWPGTHAVRPVHSRSVEPAVGAFDSHSSAVHAVWLRQTMFAVLVPALTTYSPSWHGVCATHSDSECNRSARNVASGHDSHMFDGTSRNCPAWHTRCVVEVIVVVVVVVVVPVTVVVVPDVVVEVPVVVVVTVAEVVLLVRVVVVRVVVVPEVVVVVAKHCRSETAVHACGGVTSPAITNHECPRQP